jgi:hypothetical protein
MNLRVKYKDFEIQIEDNNKIVIYNSEIIKLLNAISLEIQAIANNENGNATNVPVCGLTAKHAKQQISMQASFLIVLLQITGSHQLTHQVTSKAKKSLLTSPSLVALS